MRTSFIWLALFASVSIFGCSGNEDIGATDAEPASPAQASINNAKDALSYVDSIKGMIDGGEDPSEFVQEVAASFENYAADEADPNHSKFVEIKQKWNEMASADSSKQQTLLSEIEALAKEIAGE